MFAWVGSQIDGVLDTYVLGVVTTLCAALTPVAATVVALWVTLYGWAVLRGAATDTLPGFVWQACKVGLVLSVSLQSGLYLSMIAGTANALATGVAATFVPGGTARGITTPYALLDTFNDQASQLVLDLMKEAGITRLDLVLAAVVTAFGNVIFLCIALFVITLAKVSLTFTIAVGPLFVLCLAWRPTARFFDSWLSMLLNAAVLTWFSLFALGLSDHLGEGLLRAIQDQGGFTGTSLNVVAESLKYCVVMVLMAIICFQAPGLASAMTGGVAIQQGIQFVHNAMVVSGRRGWSARSSVATSPPRDNHPGSTASSDRMPAYRRAAQRGSS